MVSSIKSELNVPVGTSQFILNERCNSDIDSIVPANQVFANTVYI